MMVRRTGAGLAWRRGRRAGIVLLAAAWAIGWAAIPAQAAPGSSTAGPAANISMTPLSPGALTADGSSHATATVRITDAQLNPVVGDSPNLALSASDPHITFGPVIDNNDGTYTVSVISSTTAHQVMITATETSSQISASQPLTLVHGPAGVVALHLATTQLTADGIAATNAVITVTDVNGNPIAGDALALHSSHPGVRFGRVTDWGNGTYSVPVTSSNTPGTVKLRATDISSAANPTGSATLTETSAPSLLGTATMQWTFYYTHAYTVVRLLTAFGVPANASVSLSCSGHGCPFGQWTVKPGKLPRCGGAVRGACRSGGALVLAPRVAQHRLAVGARLTVRITRRGWIGKFYSFRVRAATGPAIAVSCLAPGASQPGVGCK